MVFVSDEGSYLEAPLETVWKFMGSGDPHSQAHVSMRHRAQKIVSAGVMEATMERRWRGEWVAVTNRLSLFPPLGFVVEALAGPFAGSKSFQVFRSEGARTRADVYGEFVSPTIPAAELKAAALEYLSITFDEDAPAIRTFPR